MGTEQTEESHDNPRIASKEQLKVDATFKLGRQLPSGEVYYQLVTVAREPYPASVEHPNLGDLVDFSISNPTKQTIVLPLAGLGIRQKPSSRSKMAIAVEKTSWWLEPYEPPKQNL
jgi:hypothetical protein